VVIVQTVCSFTSQENDAEKIYTNSLNKITTRIPNNPPR